MQDYRKLRVWQGAHKIVLEVYSITNSFPAAERYGLASQLRRSAASIAANIAEGAMRDSDAAFAHYLQIAAASASEVDYHILLATDLGYVEPPMYELLIRELRVLRRTLSALRTRVKNGGKDGKEEQPSVSQ